MTGSPSFHLPRKKTNHSNIIRSLAAFRVRRESKPIIVSCGDLPAMAKIDCEAQLSLPFVHTTS